MKASGPAHAITALLTLRLLLYLHPVVPAVTHKHHQQPPEQLHNLQQQQQQPLRQQ